MNTGDRHHEPKSDEMSLTGRERDLLARLDERTRAIVLEQTSLKARIERLDEDYVTKVEYAPVRSVVYGLIGAIMLAVVGAILALVVRGQQP